MSESHWAMIEELEKFEQKLSAWECDFVESLKRRGQAGRLSDKQIETLERI